MPAYTLLDRPCTCAWPLTMWQYSAMLALYFEADLGQCADGISLRGMLQTPPPRLSPSALPLVKLGGADISVHPVFAEHWDSNPMTSQFVRMLQDLTAHFVLPETYMLLWAHDGPPSPLETSGEHL